MIDPTSKLTEERGAVYGDPLGDFVCVQRMYEAWTARHEESFKDVKDPFERVLAHRHGVYMILVKLARLAYTPYHADSLADIAGYVKCLQECAPQQKPMVVGPLTAEERRTISEAMSKPARIVIPRDYELPRSFGEHEEGKTLADCRARFARDERFGKPPHVRGAPLTDEPSEYRIEPAYVERGDGELPSPPDLND